MKSRRLSIFAAVCTVMALGCGGILFAFFWLKRDPGPDERLHGKTLAEISVKLGEPASREVVSPKSIGDSVARDILEKNTREAGWEPSGPILVARRLQSGPELPTSMETTIWFRKVGDDWIAFHSYRRYQWASL